MIGTARQRRGARGGSRVAGAAARAPGTGRRMLAALGAALPAALAAGCEWANVQPGAESVLQIFAPPSPAQAARWAMDPYDADLRYRGTQMLSSAPWAGEPQHLALYEDNADDPDASVRAAAITALARHGNTSHAGVFIRGLKDEDRLVRLESARALQRVHNPEAVGALLGAIRPEEEAESDVRAEAADALGQYAERRVVQGLIGALADGDFAVTCAARASLRVLTGQDFGSRRADWQAWFNESEGAFAAGRVYEYPAFWRRKRILEYLPFFPPPPVEVPSVPIGFPIPSSP